jgi:hypothetical protein
VLYSIPLATSSYGNLVSINSQSIQFNTVAKNTYTSIELSFLDNNLLPITSIRDNSIVIGITIKDKFCR